MDVLLILNKEYYIIIEDKINFVSKRQNEILISDNIEFKDRTRKQIISIEKELEFLKDTDFMRVVYGLVRYRISYDSYCDYFDNLKNN